MLDVNIYNLRNMGICGCRGDTHVNMCKCFVVNTLATNCLEATFSYQLCVTTNTDTIRRKRLGFGLLN